ncbi:MAG: D-aminoacyl-tRNA deacylase [Planctomycetota bacterium]
MRAVIQRVSKASVVVDNNTSGAIESGLLVLLGVGKKDTDQDLNYIFDKTIGLRVFEDNDGKMNLSLKETKGSLLVVSQFTLYGDVRRGKRPSFIEAAEPEKANELYKKFIARAEAEQIDVQTGVFRADMSVSLVNDGPVTILLDSRKAF